MSTNNRSQQAAETVETELKAMAVELMLDNEDASRSAGGRRLRDPGRRVPNFNRMFEGHVSQAVCSYLSGIGFKRDSEEEGYYGPKLGTCAFKHPQGGTAVVIESNFMGSFTEVTVKNLSLDVVL